MLVCPMVILPIFADLGGPKLRACAWHSKKRAIVAVPKAAMDHDDSAISR
jgi:hypothetical protein